MASSLSQVNLAVGNVKSGSIATGKFSKTGATVYKSSSGYSGGTSGSSSGKKSSSYEKLTWAERYRLQNEKIVKEKVIYEDDPNQPGGKIAVRKITTYSTGRVVTENLTKNAQPEKKKSILEGGEIINLFEE